MKHLLLTTIAAVVLLFGGVNEVNGDPLIYKVEGETVAVVDCDKNASGELVVPSSYEAKPVTSIGDFAFWDCSSLTSVTIPNSVTIIGEGAFYDCTSLTSVTIPDSVTSIGGGAFWDCSSLTSVTIPDSVTSIRRIAFKGCSSLTSVTIGDSVTSIEDSTFDGCSSLTSVTIPDSVTSIGDFAFWDCSSLTSVTIGDSVTSIGDSAFWGCSSLTSVTIGNSVISFRNFAFGGCSSLTSVRIPDSVTSIGFYAFSGCTRLTGIEVGKGNTKYSSEDGVLFDKNKTELIQFPAAKRGHYTILGSVTSIAPSAFSGCSSLTSVTIPDSVTSIGINAFSGCSRLTGIEVGKGNTKYSSEDGVLFDKNKTELIRFPEDKSRQYTILDSVNSIGDGAFGGCSSLTSVTIGDSVSSIGWGAFYGCSSLTSITIPDGVTSIENWAFNGCSSLTSITFESNAPAIGDNVFKGVSDNAKVIINSGATGFGEKFEGLPVVIKTNEPKILTITQLLSVVLFQRLELRVEAIGINPLRYQWNKDGKPIHGAVSSALVIDSSKLSDAGNYSVSIINNYGATISDEIKVTIVPPEIRLQYLINEKGQFVLKATGPDNSKVSFQFSEDFKSWTDQFTLSLIQSSTTIRFPISSGEGDKLFYRLKLVE